MRQKAVNFVMYDYLTVCKSKKRVFFGLFIAILCACLVGCGDHVLPPSAKELTEFEKAGPRHPDVDAALLSRARGNGGAYRVMPGEVIELTMPAILQVVTAEGTRGAAGTVPYTCRVSEKGTVTLPVVGEIEVAGKTLTQIESDVIDAYYPKYATVRPPVLVRLIERIEQIPFMVIGLVNKPGTFPYPPDVQYNLMQAIAFADGLNLNLEPRYATVYRLKADGSIADVTLHIAQDSKFVEASTTHIKPGDVIAVEHTPRTRTKAFLDNVLRLNVGAYVNTWDLWQD
ncbi:MAG: polysaccharide biosynthesis/export family protein [Planctomycetota bacterium]